jgi:hypothetical protein
MRVDTTEASVVLIEIFTFYYKGERNKIYKKRFKVRDVDP